MLSLVAKVWHSIRDMIIPRELMQLGRDHGSGSTQLLLVRTWGYCASNSAVSALLIDVV